MEIQTFFLAEKITRLPENRFDVQRAMIAFLECTLETPFPCRFPLPGLILLRREETAGEMPFTLRFDLVDQDGRPAGRPRHNLVKGVFPGGPRFFALVGQIEFEFPEPGRYRLDIRVNDPAGNLFAYNIDLLLCNSK